MPYILYGSAPLENFRWSDDGINLQIITPLVLRHLSDPSLAVHIEASKALYFLIKVKGSDVTILPVIHHILHGYFHMMTYTGNDEVVGLRNFFRVPLKHRRGL